jgi:hypothetical protein
MIQNVEAEQDAPPTILGWLSLSVELSFAVKDRPRRGSDATECHCGSGYSTY